MTYLKKFLINFLGLGYYISSLDEFLSEFDKKHPKSSHSQHKEKEKYARIYNLRDNPDAPQPKEQLWDKF